MRPVEWPAQSIRRAFRRRRGFSAQVRVDPEIGTVTWPNGYDMTPELLYEEALEHQAPQAASCSSPLGRIAIGPYQLSARPNGDHRP